MEGKLRVIRDPQGRKQFIPFYRMDTDTTGHLIEAGCMVLVVKMASPGMYVVLTTKSNTLLEIEGYWLQPLEE